MADSYLAQRVDQARGELERIRKLWRPVAKRIRRIEVQYSGYGDEGNIEGVDFFAADNEPVLLKGPRADQLRIAVEEYCDAVLPGGWEINDGACGMISLDWGAREVLIEHNDRYTAYETTTVRQQLGGR